MKRIGLLCGLLLLACMALAGCADNEADAGAPVSGGVAEPHGVPTGEEGREANQAADKHIHVFNLLEEVGVDFSAEDTEVIDGIFYNNEWVNDITKCASDYQIIMGNENFYYHSECGTVNDIQNGRSFTITDEQRNQVNNLLSDRMETPPSADVIQFGNRWIDKASLSAETIDWLEKYNALSEEEQLAISYVPHDLLEKCGLNKAGDMEAKAE